MIQRTYGNVSYLSYNGYDEMAAYLEDNKKHDTVRRFSEEIDEGYEDEWFDTKGLSWSDLLYECRHGRDASQVERMDRLRQEISKAGDHGTVWNQKHDVSGAYVDIDRFLVGEPECMYAFDENIDRRSGSVVTIAAPITAHAGIAADAIRRRGEQIVKAILSVDAYGLQTEVYACMWIKDWGDMKRAYSKTLIKGAGEPLSAERVMFAFGRVAAFRAIGLPSMLAHDKTFHEPMGFRRGGGFGQPIPHLDAPLDDTFLPENTVYIDGLEDNRQADLDITAMVFNKLGLSQASV